MEGFRRCRCTPLVWVIPASWARRLGAAGTFRRLLTAGGYPPEFFQTRCVEVRDLPRLVTARLASEEKSPRSAPECCLRADERRAGQLRKPVPDDTLGDRAHQDHYRAEVSCAMSCRYLPAHVPAASSAPSFRRDLQCPTSVMT